MAGSSSDDAVTFALYRYIPSIPAAVVMAVAFGFLGVFYACRFIRERTYFFIPFIIGLLCKFPQLSFSNNCIANLSNP